MRLLLGVLVAFALILTTGCGHDESQSLEPAPITQADAEAIFDYAYPLVIMQISQDVMFTVPFRDKSWPNRFIHFKTLAQPKQKAVVLGNRNTLYSVGWLDLSQGPVVFQIPDMGERYYVMPLLDAWTNTFRSIGSRTTGQGQQSYLIANSDWTGEVPDGFELITSPTNMVWITGRIQADSPEDATAVGALQEQYTLQSLDVWQGGEDIFADYKPRFKALGVRKPVPYSLKMKPRAFYDTFLAAWANNASPAADQGMIDLLETAGLKRGSAVRYSDLADNVKAVLKAGLLSKQAAYLDAFYQGTEQTDPWIFNLDPNMGDWATQYDRRAYWAMWGLGTNIVDDAVYGVTQLDSDLDELNGQQIYKMHFAQGTTPPSGAFWSVTNYDTDGYLEKNDLDRYSLGSHQPIVFNADGSLDFSLSHVRPEGVENWVPAPKDKFKTLLRIYWPDQAVLDGQWQLPPLDRVK